MAKTKKPLTIGKLWAGTVIQLLPAQNDEDRRCYERLHRLHFFQTGSIVEVGLKVVSGRFGFEAIAWSTTLLYRFRSFKILSSPYGLDWYKLNGLTGPVYVFHGHQLVITGGAPYDLRPADAYLPDPVTKPSPEHYHFTFRGGSFCRSEPVGDGAPQVRIFKIRRGGQLLGRPNGSCLIQHKGRIYGRCTGGDLHWSATQSVRKLHSHAGFRHLVVVGALNVKDDFILTELIDQLDLDPVFHPDYKADLKPVTGPSPGGMSHDAGTDQ